MTKTFSDLEKDIKTLKELKKEMHRSLNDMGVAQSAILEIVDDALDQAYLLGAVDETESIGESIDAVKGDSDGA